MNGEENDAARQARFERLDKEALMRAEAKYDARLSEQARVEEAEELDGLWDSGVESFANALKSRFEDRGWSVRVKSQAVSDDEFVF